MSLLLSNLDPVKESLLIHLYLLNPVYLGPHISKNLRALCGATRTVCLKGANLLHNLLNIFRVFVSLLGKGEPLKLLILEVNLCGEKSQFFGD